MTGLDQYTGIAGLRLIADDLTGALDTAAQFVAHTGPVPVFWQAPARLPHSAALDSGTREGSAEAAEAAAAMSASMLAPAPGIVAFKKLDSLLRGHSGAELAAVLRALPGLAHCIIAPAFPYQGRVTRGGLQYARAAAAWAPVGEDLVASLSARGIAVRRCRPGDAVPPGASLWDAETDADLAQIAAAGSARPGVLWCGSSGLAGALAGPHPAVSGVLARPALGLFGTNHPVTAAQIAAARHHWLALADGGAASATALAGRLGSSGAVLAGFDLPPGLPRAEVAARIAAALAALAGHLAPPRTLIVAGGETLRALCVAVGARYLEVQGQILPGVPRSILRGGAWHGVDVVSKSGAFGEARLLADLLDGAQERSGA